MSKRYEQYCPVAHALGLVGERWALLIVRELLHGPQRYTDLTASLPGIGTNILAARLRELEDSGVVQKRRLPPPAASTVYELTEYGRDLEPVLLAFGRWGARRLGEYTPEEDIQGGWFCVALKAYFRPEAAKTVRATIDLGLDGERYTLKIDRGALEIVAGAPAAADLSLTTEPLTLFGYLGGAPVPVSALAPAGDEELLGRLREIFAFGG